MSNLTDVSHRAPQTAEHLIKGLLGDEVQVLGQRITAEGLTQRILNALASVLRPPAAPVRVIWQGVAVIMGGFLTLLLFFYFLLHGERLARGVLWLAPPHQRPWLRSLGAQIHPLLRCYFCGVAIIVVLTTLVSWIGVGLVLALPQAWLLACATGILELIPVVGPLTSATLAGAVALAQGNLWVVVGVALFFIALRVVIDQLPGPLVLGAAVSLHPVVILFALLASAVLFGILGIVLAVPLAATIKLLCLTLYSDRHRTRLRIRHRQQKTEPQSEQLSRGRGRNLYLPQAAYVLPTNKGQSASQELSLVAATPRECR